MRVLGRSVSTGVIQITHSAPASPVSISPLGDSAFPLIAAARNVAGRK